jgi:hypothetical protein
MQIDILPCVDYVDARMSSAEAKALRRASLGIPLGISLVSQASTKDQSCGSPQSVSAANRTTLGFGEHGADFSQEFLDRSGQGGKVWALMDFTPASPA